jgi:hypothetical protein
VGTITGMRVRVHCAKVIPVSLTEWTQYEVTDVSGSVQVAAHKKDVRIEIEGSLKKTPAVTDTAGTGMHEGGSVVHEGEQVSRRETELCGAPLRPTGAGVPVNAKLLGAAAAGGGGLLICLLAHCFGGGSGPVSPATP